METMRRDLSGEPGEHVVIAAAMDAKTACFDDQ